MGEVTSEAERLGYTQRYSTTCVQRITESVDPKSTSESYLAGIRRLNFFWESAINKKDLWHVVQAEIEP